MSAFRKWASIYIAAVGKGVGTVAGFQNANALFRWANKVDPDNADALAHQGYICIEKNENEQAIPFFDEALKRKQHWEYYGGRGSAYRRSGRYQEAVLDFNKALELQHSMPPMYYERAITYYQMGDLIRAQADLDWAIEKMPAFALALYYRALIYHNSGDYERASSDYRNAVRADGRLPNRLYQQAVMDMQGSEQDHQDAVFMLRNILALSDNVQFRQKCLALLDELEGAIPDGEKP